jgi:CBS domain-containing protein
MNKKTEIFIEKFQRLEKLLKQTAGSSDEDSFYFSLKKAADHNVYIRKNFHLALDLAALRNVFAHRERGMYIASVNKFALRELEKLIEAVKNPPSVISKFKVEVYEAKTTDFISSVMRRMREETYTHVPVWNGKKFIGVFSYTSFFEWLAEKQSEGSGEITFAKRVMGDIDRRYLNSPSVNYEFIKQKTNLYEIPPIFEEATRKRKRQDCLLITQNGVRGEKIIGIITSWDLGAIT